jgi:hypothetical protein
MRQKVVLTVAKSVSQAKLIAIQACDSDRRWVAAVGRSQQTVTTAATPVKVTVWGNETGSTMHVAHSRLSVTWCMTSQRQRHPKAVVKVWGNAPIRRIGARKKIAF